MKAYYSSFLAGEHMRDVIFRDGFFFRSHLFPIPISSRIQRANCRGSEVIFSIIFQNENRIYSADILMEINETIFCQTGFTEISKLNFLKEASDFERYSQFQKILKIFHRCHLPFPLPSPGNKREKLFFE